MNEPLEEKRDKKLAELYSHEAEELAEVMSNRYQLPYVDLSKTAINTDAIRLIPLLEAKTANAAAFRIVGRTVSLAILSPGNVKVNEIKADLEQKNFTVSLYITSENSLARAWNMYTEISESAASDVGLIQISDEQIASYLGQFKTLSDIQEALLKENTSAERGSGISVILEMILSGALASDASDVHIEPEEKTVRLRYRLDGVLMDVADISPRIYRQIMSRIKLVSGMKLNVKLSAQDGRFGIKVSGQEIEIRSSIIPSAYGESIVMRVLNPKSIQLTFDNLGVEPALFKIFETEIHKPNGLILMTGPTGSGKTTTLYAFLRRINSTESKIITIEDPIEYHLEGINQTQVNREKGYTFLSGLRSALRQDPDILMVGEIRDGETAKIAINSALTGHLVFSTLHTNNAAGTIPRLIDLGVNPKIISSALTISIAQRLVRKLCPKCKQSAEPKPEDKTLLVAVAESIKKKRPDLVVPAVNQIYEPVGCLACNNTGFKGREGIFEAILMDDAIAAVTTSNSNEKELRKAAVPQGILDMRQDGILKVLNGETALEELRRVIDLSEEII
jgi:type IV pilus assembly protein PilB